MKKKVANIVMVAVFAFTVIYLMISSDLKTKWEFKKNGILLNGKIVDISMLKAVILSLVAILLNGKIVDISMSSKKFKL